MRTTLKRGIGRGATIEANGRPVLPPGVAVSGHRLPPAGTSEAFGLGDVPDRSRLVVRRTARRDRLGCGRRVSLVPRKRCGRRRDDTGREGRCEAPRCGATGPAGHSARDRLRQARERVEGLAVALRHRDAGARRPGDRVRFAALLPSRSLRQDLLPRPRPLRRPHQQRLRDVRHEGDTRDGPEADGTPGQLPDHRQLPWLPPARRRGRRRLDRRGPALFQQPRRRLRLRHDQPLPRLPEARWLPGARLRPLPPHRLRPLPGRPPAALLARVQGPDPRQRRATRPAGRDQDDHQERRGRRRRKHGARRSDRAPLRALRILAPAGPLLPVEAGGHRGDVRLRSPRTRGEHPESRSGVRASRRRVAEEGNPGRAE